jgi:hypothetical protein
MSKLSQTKDEKWANFPSFLSFFKKCLIERLNRRFFLIRLDDKHNRHFWWPLW